MAASMGGIVLGSAWRRWIVVVGGPGEALCWRGDDLVHWTLARPWVTAALPRPPVQDDCFAGAGPRLLAGEALALLQARVAPVVAAETLPLAAACGRLLAEPLIGERDVPAFDNVAVDGFALAHADLAPDRPTRLALVEGRAAAGHPYGSPLPSGRAVRVLTGGALPAGADTVVMQEDVEVAAGAVTVPPGLRPGVNRRRAGEDIRAGAIVLPAGRRLRPQEIGVAASLGRTSLAVWQPLNVALLSTGDELIEPGQPLRHGQAYDSNRSMLQGLLVGLGCQVTDLGICADRPAVVAERLASAARDHDVIISSGGVSQGDEDHVALSVERLGRLHFWQIAVKPGRPLAFGQLGGAIFVGLPGNPVAAALCFLLFARPMLIRLAGGAWPEPTRYPVPATFTLPKKPGRREYLRGRLVTADGHLAVERIAREGSGILTSLCEADGLIELAEDRQEVRPGQAVDFLPFSELGLAP